MFSATLYMMTINSWNSRSPITNQIEILHSFYCPLLPPGKMEDCKVMSSETFVCCRGSASGQGAALGARREQQGEVKMHGTLVLLGDNLEASIPLGDHQVVSSFIAEHTYLLQADRTIVAVLVFACWSSTCRDNQPTCGQLFIQNLDNLVVVLDVPFFPCRANHFVNCLLQIPLGHKMLTL